jgi:hypothetical protein
MNSDSEGGQFLPDMGYLHHKLFLRGVDAFFVKNHTPRRFVRDKFSAHEK